MSLGILVLSSDKYAHIWPGFFQAWNKYFPNCRWPVYLGSNSVGFDHQNVKTILSGDDPDWSTSLLRILKQIPEDYIFIILEDVLLASPFHIERFAKAFEFLAERQGRHLKYYRPENGDIDIPGTPYSEYARRRPYRISVVGFWNKKYLESLLIPGESPWNFEIMGSYRTSYVDGFYMMKEPLCEFANMIEKGRWYPGEIKWARREGFDVGESARKTLSGFYLAKSQLQKMIYWFLRRTPWTWRLGLMNFLRRLFGSY